MAVPVALMAAGTALQIFGQYQANMAQAKQELANAAFYKAQAEFAKESEFRQADIAAKEYEFRKGAQISAYAKGGVDISGSAAGVVSQTLADKVSELTAIKRKGAIEYRLAMSRSKASTSMANTLQSFEYNFLQAGGTALTAAAKASDSWPKGNTSGGGGGGGNSYTASAHSTSSGGSGYLGANTKL